MSLNNALLSVRGENEQAIELRLIGYWLDL